MNKTKFYVNQQGRYLGGWDASPPDGGIEVANAPVDARQRWQFPGWSEVPESVPLWITRRQARLALLSVDKLLVLEAAIAGIADSDQQMAAQIEYENDTWERSNPWVDQLGAEIGLTPADIDQLFITASGL